MATRPRTPYEDTSVPSHKSREDTERLLRSAGAKAFSWYFGEDPQDPDKTVLALRFKRPTKVGEAELPLAVRIMVQVPEPTARTEKQREKEYDQLIRQCHRALHYYVKSQIEAVMFGLVHFTEAFLPHLEMGNGLTVYQQIAPQYLQAVASGEVRPLALLPGR